MLVLHRIDNPPREPDSFEDRWSTTEKALVVCWLRGIRLATEQPALAARAQAGELPLLWWKGGTDKPLKTKAQVWVFELSRDLAGVAWRRVVHRSGSGGHAHLQQVRSRSYLYGRREASSR
jgi:hypothetical protein